MAEFAAHLTSTSQSYLAKPSIFELLAQESLSTGLKRAALHVTRILAQSHPQRFLYLNIYFEEIYLLFDCLVQYSHLKAYHGSFAEHFYGIKRVSLNNKSDQRLLSTREFYSSLMLLVGFPFLKAKLDTLYERLKFAHLEGRLTERNQPAQYAFIKAYPTISSLCLLIKLCYQLSYAVGNSKLHSPLMKLANVRLTYITQDDLNDNPSLQISESSLHWFDYFKSISLFSTKWLATGLGAGLSLGAFFIQFLDYWYNREGSKPNFAPMPIPPPPQPFRIEIPNEFCPICLQKRRNDTVLSTSGFVFCYSCIRKFILEHNRCPVTGYPANAQHLVRLYPPDG